MGIFIQGKDNRLIVNEALRILPDGLQSTFIESLSTKTHELKPGNPPSLPTVLIT